MAVVESKLPNRVVFSCLFPRSTSNPRSMLMGRSCLFQLSVASSSVTENARLLTCIHAGCMLGLLVTSLLS